MPTPEALNALADRVEREEPSRGLDSAIYRATRLPEAVAGNTIPRYTTSLDAAVTLVPTHDGRRWFWRAGESSLYKGWAHVNRLHPDNCDKKDEASAQASTPAAALTAAALRARAADMQARAEDGAPHSSPSGN